METFEQNLIKKFGHKVFKNIRNTCVGIAGAGGLGSNCAANLVRSGFTKFVIADFDTVTEANLDRQFYFLDQVGLDKIEALEGNLRRINPVLNLKMAKLKISKDNIADLFNDCDIVMECLDRAESKAELVKGLLALDKFVIAVSGLGGTGSSDDIRVRRVKKNLVLIGDLSSDIAQKAAMSPRVSIAAAKQADTALAYVKERLG